MVKKYSVLYTDSSKLLFEYKTTARGEYEAGLIFAAHTILNKLQDVKVMWIKEETA